MALPICVEAFVRLFFVVIKLAIENWFWAISILVIGFVFYKSKFLVGALGSFVNILEDLLSGLQIFSGGVLSVLGGLLAAATLSSILGLLWGLMVLTSPANLVLKIMATPFYIVLGALWGLVPLPLPLSLVISYLFKDKNVSNIVCLVPIVVVVALSLLGVDFFCSWLNFALKTLSS